MIGGGDSAMEDSIFISKYADKLTSVHRRGEYRASQIMLDRAREQGNIDFKTPFVPEEFVAGDDGKLRAIRLRNADRGGTEELEVGGAFVAIGHIPRSELVAEQVDVDEEGYVLTDGKSTRTNLGRRVRRRRPGRPHVPPGGDRRRHRLHGRARRGVVPARHPAVARGPLAAGRRADRGSAHALRQLGSVAMAVVEAPSGSAEAIGLRPVPEFDGVHETWPRGDRPAAIREAAGAFRERFATPENRVHGVRTVDIASAPYPLKFAFGGAAKGANPYVNIINRLAGRPVRGLRGPQRGRWPTNPRSPTARRRRRFTSR